MKIFSSIKYNFANREDVLKNEQIKNRIRKKWDARSENKKKSMFFEDKSDMGKV